MIQRNYSRAQQLGQVGEIARPNSPHNIDQGIAGVELKPGDGVYFVSGSNWIKPVSAATRKLVTHIVGFNKNLLNTDIAVPTGNNVSEVVYAVAAIVPLVEFGCVFAIAGEAVLTQDSAVYNESTGKWIKYSPSPATADDLRKKPFYFYVDPGKTIADGDLVEIRVPSVVYSFLALDATTTDDLQTEIDAVETGAGLATDGTYVTPAGTNYIDTATDLADADDLLDAAIKAVADLAPTTVKVSLTVAQIKALRATPVELVAAQGAGTLIEFISATLVLTAGSEVLTEATDNLAIEYDDGAGLAIVPAIEATGFIDQAADTITTAIGILDGIDALADVANKNLVLQNIGTGEYAGNASDDAALDVHITYRVLSV